MPFSPIYLDLNVNEIKFLGVRLNCSISGKVSSSDPATPPSLLTKAEVRQVNKLLQGYRTPEIPQKTGINALNGLGAILTKLVGDTVNIEDLQGLLLRVRPEYQEYITNIPWELAALKKIETPTPDFSQLLADKPFARMIEGYNCVLPEPDENKIKIHYCISDVKNTLNPAGFRKTLDSALKLRSVFVNASSTTNLVKPDEPDNPVNFLPDFNQLLTDITAIEPDILILVSHGRTRSGKPYVEFASGWQPVEHIANVTRGMNRTSLVIMIACDLTYSGGPKPAYSGAVTFLSKGVPAVIAMQSKILVDCGEVLLDKLINYLLTIVHIGNNNASLLKAMWAARLDLYAKFGGKDFKDLDWSFPALFVTAGNEDGFGKKVRNWMFGYINALKSIRSNNFKRTTPFIIRPYAARDLFNIFTGDLYGVRTITGPSGCGKTTVINHAGDQYYHDIIESRATHFKQLIYVNFENEEQRNLDQPIGIYNAINNRIENIVDQHSSIVLIKKMSLSSGSGSDDLFKAVNALENQKAIFILDNLKKHQLLRLNTFLEKAQELFRHSLILITGNDLPFENAVTIDNFSAEETAAYLAHLLPKADMAAAYALTGGNPSLVNYLELTEGTNIPILIKPFDKCALILENVENGGDDLLTAMSVIAQFDKGLTPQLLKYASVTSAQKNLLEDMGAIEVKDDVVCMPEIMRQYLTEEQPDLIDYGRNSFLVAFDEFFREDNDIFIYLISLQEGFYFILSMLKMSLRSYALQKEEAELERARSILTLSHPLLFISSNWANALELIQAYNKSVNPRLVRASDYLKEAKCAEVLGMQELLGKCIIQAIRAEKNDTEQINLLQLKAGYYKNSGDFSKLKKIRRLYAEAEKLVNNLLARAVELPDGLEHSEILEFKALVFYNRSIVEWWWAHAAAAANEYMSVAKNIFEEAGNNAMSAVSNSELADMRIHSAVTPEEFENIRNVLNKARLYFSANNIFGDLATTTFRLGRMCKRFPVAQGASRIPHYQKALANYEDCVIYSIKSGMRLQEVIARAHITVLRSPGFLNESNTERAVSDLNKVLQELKLYDTHPWAKRNVRNLSWRIAELTGQDEAVYIALEEALHPRLEFNSLSDKGIAVMLIREALTRTRNDEQKQQAFTTRFGNKISQWFGLNNVPSFESVQALANQYQPINPYNYG